ncbi:SDR family oxidoreductase [Streptomyces clavuligerus]|uniref:Short-chain dehydrogenase/reductase SDR n=1 Tax=Streptomyces clavuligerus TaxID=1901 RepID=B5GLP1_STRCL|nr:SDR family oxidoreductase [Streptomyces clavuligerus]EDY47237.1 short-chain dehydrogenase/reductase SDR [Streptomyces clavuligerus]EFG04902.1 short-chain dehydrogenase/reductase SDR [Streptomyces clavuligerus]MBY6306659.1 SDR family oxidoreductase [Streptomyces clavuligerus]QCS10734.1 SDR family NAD(P)-dependent oxidoreductase [Streptomyces clavuligerus]QPJ97230.1 SDR family NAD(P)-dependent oxidoreductase [Streptomyces clavuligerus]
MDTQGNDMKTVLITGTSSGIGLATAVAAARAGMRVIATMRDTGKAGPLRHAAAAAGVADRVEVLRLDVVDPASVSSCVAEAIDRHGRLDAVVNNAGAGRVGTIEIGGTDEVRSTMEVNFFGVVEVTRATLPQLRASRGRLITVTSVGGVVGQPFNEAYCAAKFAVEGFMESLAPVVATFGVDVTVVEPGAVASEFVTSAVPDLPALVNTAGPYAPALQAYVDRTRKSFGTAQTADEAAASIIEALTAEKPAFRIQTSDWARGFVGTKLTDLDGSAVQSLTDAWVR